jgi:hypothetical protein
MRAGCARNAHLVLPSATAMEGPSLCRWLATVCLPASASRFQFQTDSATSVGSSPSSSAALRPVKFIEPLGDNPLEAGLADRPEQPRSVIEDGRAVFQAGLSSASASSSRRRSRYDWPMRSQGRNGIGCLANRQRLVRSRLTGKDAVGWGWVIAGIRRIVTSRCGSAAG